MDKLEKRVQFLEKTLAELLYLVPDLGSEYFDSRDQIRKLNKNFKDNVPNSTFYDHDSYDDIPF